MSENSDEVVIHETSVATSTDVKVGEADSKVDSVDRRAGLASPLPIRIRDGSFEDDHLNAAGEPVPYDSITFMALGVIDQMTKDSTLKAGAVQKMVKKVTGGSTKDNPKERAKQTREVYILDVFTTLQDPPFRFVASSINYKQFLDRAGYVSHHNFYKFCVHFARRVAPETQVNTSYAMFLAKNKLKVAHFEDYHDFELEVALQQRQQRDMQTLEDVDLSKDSWVEEWTDDV